MKRIISAVMTVVMFVSMFSLGITANAATLIWPVPGHYSLSRGQYYNNENDYHNGMDITDGSINGATVVAAVGGTVCHIRLCGSQHLGDLHDCEGFGTGIIIYGDDGRWYQYAHMQAGSIPSNVYFNAYVSAGQKIGSVGTTGNSSGPHLHFQINTTNKWNGSVNPENETYGSAHTCSYSSSVTKAATCNATGVRTYTCSCGKSYTETIAKNASNHSGGETIKNAVAATTSSTGYTGDTYCKGCNALLRYGTTIPKIDETQWVYVSAVPSHVTTDKYEIEYNNIYKKTATTSPGSSWTKGELVKTEYVNDGSTYESDFELSTSSTRVLVNYYYYHWCGSSTGNYVNFAYTDSFNHYDAYPEPNAVIEESSVADSDDSRYIAYKLAWAHDPSGHCYCAPALTCDSSNSHTTRSCWWYKRYIYQNKTAVKYYEFTKESGWSEQKDSSADAVEYRYKLIDGYTVSYNANGGSGAPSSQTKTTGQSITLSSTKPTRSGYTFKCWNTKADGTGTNYYSGGSYSADANLTLYAQWTENTTTQFKVTYNANGGTSILQYEYAEEGSTITLTTPFKYFKLNYDANGGTNAPSTSSLSVDCLGWASSSTATSAAYKCGASYMPTSNVTLYAVWKNSVRTNLSSQKPVREGYTFLGWALDPNASEAQFSAGETVDVSGDATLYAVWGTESAKTGYSFWEWIIIIVFFGWIWYV